jgi:hypothetical protein
VQKGIEEGRIVGEVVGAAINNIPDFININGIYSRTAATHGII